MSSIPNNKNGVMPDASGDTIVLRFERQAISHADRIAVNDVGEQSSTRWTYRELNHCANCIARAIVERAAELSDAASPVAVLMNTGAPSVAAIIATMKAGRVCVPIDSSYPEARVREVIEDAGARLLVTDNANIETALRLDESGCTVFNIDELKFEEATPQEAFNLDLGIDANSAAYLIYTSGSTGRPKGVIETHRNVLHHVEHYAQALDYQPTDRVALLASCSVGQGMKTLCSTLLNGAALCPFNIKSRGIEALAKWLLEEKISVFISVPSVFRRLVRQTSTRSEFPDLRLIRLGGETLHRQDVEDFRQCFSPQCRLANSFSSTETGNIALFFIGKTTPVNGNTVPVGFVSAGIKVSILDDSGREVGPDDVGEIVVHSAWLSPGYWRNTQLTQQAFQQGRNAGEQTYRTGDLGSLSRDGLLQHRGRKDSQVKIRGFRVELGEVEATITAHSAVREAVVIARPDAYGDNSLVAFVVTEGGCELGSLDLRRFLTAKLPQHAIPASFELLAELPLTSNGKLDRAQLLSASTGHPNRIDKHDSSSVPPRENCPDAPRGEIEKRLAKVWMDVLQVPRIGLHDDFFELGGHSLLTIALLAQIEEEFSHDMAHAAIFGAATIASQAELLRRSELQNETPSWPSIVALHPVGTRPPLFFVQDRNDSLMCYRELVQCLYSDQPVYGLRPAEQSDQLSTHLSEPTRSIEETAAIYVNEMRAFQPRGDFYLCGYSFAGTLAFEIALQLEAQGRRVAFLALLDTYCRAHPAYREQKLKPLTRRQRQKNHRYIWRHLRARDRIVYFSYYAQQRVNSIRERLMRPRTTDKRSLLKKEVARRCAEKGQHNRAASASYRVQSYAGRITLFRAMLDYRAERGLDLGWNLVAKGGVDVIEVSGNHAEILKVPHVRLLARHFKRCLSEAQQNDWTDGADSHQDNPVLIRRAVQAEL